MSETIVFLLLYNKANLFVDFNLYRMDNIELLKTNKLNKIETIK